MKKIVLKYFIEFLVIFFGITISFYWEKQNALSYKEELKNASLSKIKQNILYEKEDFELNLSIHNDAVKAIYNLYEFDRYENIKYNDSLSDYLFKSLEYVTILVENTEEYTSLKNSGLIELIENQEIVTLLQNKYSNHKFIKEIESIILRDFSPELRDFVSRNTKYNLEGEKYFGIMEPRKYSSKNKIPQYILEKFMNKAQHHKTYIKYVKTQLEMDSEIISKINNEIEK
tara:strand:- start:47 stop:736 length:690 start_codon:yes stop_codon:yes gene_type:complete